ncbi:hypothetical protein N9C31_04500 [Gammaproteobacteria bacterium]|nr:hypothetical protein [Gammaproteobacteria bacterium]
MNNMYYNKIRKKIKRKIMGKKSKSPENMTRKQSVNEIKGWFPKELRTDENFKWIGGLNHGNLSIDLKVMTPKIQQALGGKEVIETNLGGLGQNVKPGDLIEKLKKIQDRRAEIVAAIEKEKEEAEVEERIVLEPDTGAASTSEFTARQGVAGEDSGVPGPAPKKAITGLTDHVVKIMDSSLTQGLERVKTFNQSVQDFISQASGELKKGYRFHVFSEKYSGQLDQLRQSIKEPEGLTALKDLINKGSWIPTANDLKSLESIAPEALESKIRGMMQQGTHDQTGLFSGEALPKSLKQLENLMRIIDEAIEGMPSEMSSNVFSYMSQMISDVRSLITDLEKLPQEDKGKAIRMRSLDMLGQTVNFIASMVKTIVAVSAVTTGLVAVGSLDIASRLSQLGMAVVTALAAATFKVVSFSVLAIETAVGGFHPGFKPSTTEADIIMKTSELMNKAGGFVEKAFEGMKGFEKAGELVMKSFGVEDPEGESRYVGTRQPG